MNKLKFTISEPWGFEVDGSNTIKVKFVKVIEGPKNVQYILLEAMRPFVFESVKCNFFTASPRYEGDSIEILKNSSLTVGASVFLEDIDPKTIEVFSFDQVKYVFIGSLGT